MKVKIYTRGDEYSNKIVAELEKQLKEANIKIVKKEPKIIISVGGDGTMLRAFQDNIKRIKECSFLGIKTGTLGFYSDFNASEVKEIVNIIKNNDIIIQEHNALEFQICTDEECKTGYAFNEITLINPRATQLIDVYVNNELFYTSRGTGICVSTSTGSTAYNKSLGGAVVDSKLPIMQVVEMASINNNAYRSLASSFIVGEDSKITLKPSDMKKLFFTYDSKSIALSNYKILYVTFLI